MRSHTTRGFWRCYDALPRDIQDRARDTFARWLNNPSHPGLQFKVVHAEEPIYSVRLSRGFRALGLLDGDTVTWFWIGNHEDYDRMISRL